MNLLKLSRYLGQTYVDFSFKSDKVCLLDDSSTGKSYLFSLLCKYYTTVGVKYKRYFYDNFLSTEELKVIVKEGTQVIICDNFDLYCNQTLIDALVSIPNVLVIISSKGYIASKCGIFNYYISRFNGDIISLKEF